MANEHRQHRQRVKAEFRDNGMDHFPPHKVLEMMLFYSFAQGDTNPLAHRLIERFGSLSGVFDAPYSLLLEVEGVGQETATYLKALSAFVRRYMVDAYSAINTIKTPEDAKSYVQYRFLSDTVEHVLLVCMNHSGKIVFSDSIAKGTLEKVDLIPSDVVKACLRANAAKAVLAHNHPGGFCNPSRRDLSTTYLIHDELERVDVQLFDHVIVASDGVFSMRESGMIPGVG